jgi:hypothetical protein
LHEAIVSEELFDRVQEVRTWRARVVKPGPPSDEYLLRKLLYCERCGARMHGTRGSRPPVRRYLCSTRRHGDGCDQPITRAEPLEDQLVEWISDFRPDEELRTTIFASIRTAARGSNDDASRRRELVGQLERLRDLYVMGDLSKSEYVLRRQALEEELSRTRPPFDPRLEKAEELLADFGRIWALEQDAATRRRLLATLFDRVWQEGGTIIAVKPREAFLRYFQAADELARRREKKRGVKSGSDRTRTRDLRRDRRADGFAASRRRSPKHDELAEDGWSARSSGRRRSPPPFSAGFPPWARRGPRHGIVIWAAGAIPPTVAGPFRVSPRSTVTCACRVVAAPQWTVVLRWQGNADAGR